MLRRYENDLTLQQPDVGSGERRRITVPLDGSSEEVKVEDLMRDETSYTSADMPRVNPNVKVWVPTYAAPPSPCCTRIRC